MTVSYDRPQARTFRKCAAGSITQVWGCKTGHDSTSGGYGREKPVFMPCRLVVGPTVETMPDKEILVIDDEQMILDMLDQILSAAGYKVRTALGGKEAMEVFAENPVKLVLTDIKMPGIDGYHLLREIKGEYPDTRIVLMSGYSNDLSIREAIELGADEFVVKPFKGKEILQVLESAME